MQVLWRSPLACGLALPLRITPEDQAHGADLDHRSGVDRHLPILRIFPAQAAHGFSMACPAMKNFGRAANQNISKVLPVFAISVDHQRSLRISLKISYPLELCRAGSLRLLVNRRVEMFSVKNKADGYDVRLTIKAGGSEMGNPRGTNEGKMFLCERHRE